MNNNTFYYSNFQQLFIISQFYADLLNALFESSPTEVRNQILDPSPAFVETIYTMLAATRPISTA